MPTSGHIEYIYYIYNIHSEVCESPCIRLGKQPKLIVFIISYIGYSLLDSGQRNVIVSYTHIIYTHTLIHTEALTRRAPAHTLISHSAELEAIYYYYYYYSLSLTY